MKSRKVPAEPAGSSKGLFSKAAASEEPRAYPLGRTVRRIRSTKSVRAAELVRRPGPRGGSERCEKAAWEKARLGLAGEQGDFFNSLLERHGRPCTKVGGRPCVALRTPDRLCNCLGPEKLRPARKQGIEQLIGGKRNHPRRLCSSRQRRVLHHHMIRLISCWSVVPLWHSQWRTG